MKVLFAVICLFAGSASFATSSEFGCPLPKGKVSMQVKDAKVSEVLSFLFGESHMPSELIDSPALQKKIDVDKKDIEMCDLFKIVMKQAKLDYKIKVEATATK